MKFMPAIVCSVVLLAACGQKGPLYLPEQTPPSKPYSECDVPDAPCREQVPADATPITLDTSPVSTESNIP